MQKAALHEQVWESRFPAVIGGSTSAAVQKPGTASSSKGGKGGAGGRAASSDSPKGKGEHQEQDEKIGVATSTAVVAAKDGGGVKAKKKLAAAPNMRLRAAFSVQDASLEGLHQQRQQSPIASKEGSTPSHSQQQQRSMTPQIGGAGGGSTAARSNVQGTGGGKRALTPGFSHSFSPSYVQQQQQQQGEGRGQEMFACHEFLPVSERGMDDENTETMITGYDRMTAAIQRLHTRIGPYPLDDRWKRIAAWVDRYHDDEDLRQMVHNIHYLQKRINVELADKPNPCAVRTAVSFMLLEQVLHIAGRSLPPLRDAVVQIRNDILKSIYVLPQPELLDKTFFFLSDPKDENAREELVERFYGKTYFQATRMNSKKLAVTCISAEKEQGMKNKQMLVLNRVVAHWQTYTLKRLFRAWNAQVKGERTLKALQKQLETRDKTIEELRKDLERSKEKLEKEKTAHEAKVKSLENEIDLLKRISEVKSRTVAASAL